MEKISPKYQKVINSKEYQQGKKDFLEGKLKIQGVPFSWHKKTIPAKEWHKDHYAEVGYTILKIQKDSNSTKEVTFAFISTNKTNGCLECDFNELRTIQAHREASHRYPQPMERA